jgi:enoyl-CoA hydratase/carnithine racemase
MSLVRYDADGPIAVITLDHPPVNALSSRLSEDLDAAVERAEDPAIRAVVVTGAPHFAAGADITEFQAAFADDRAHGLANRLSEVITRLELLSKPVLAAVRGFALGGGLELAMGCDFRFLAEDARVGQPEIKLGIIPGAGGTQRLARLVGLGRARDIVYTGRFVDASEALEIGLADRVVAADAVLDAALERAATLAEGATAAIGLAKRVMNDGLGVALARGLAMEADAFDAAFATEDAREGVDAFLAKRPPDFRGR